MALIADFSLMNLLQELILNKIHIHVQTYMA